MFFFVLNGGLEHLVMFKIDLLGVLLDIGDVGDVHCMRDRRAIPQMLFWFSFMKYALKQLIWSRLLHIVLPSCGRIDL